MGAGRPPGGLDHVDRLEGPAALKRRLRVILETLTGERSITEACRELDVSEARFHVLRRRALEGALGALAAGPPGRPRRPSPEELLRVAELEREVARLEEVIETETLVAELERTVPGLVDRPRRKSRRRKR